MTLYRPFALLNHSWPVGVCDDVFGAFDRKSTHCLALHCCGDNCDFASKYSSAESSEKFAKLGFRCRNVESGCVICVGDGVIRGDHVALGHPYCSRGRGEGRGQGEMSKGTISALAVSGLERPITWQTFVPKGRIESQFEPRVPPFGHRLLSGRARNVSSVHLA